MRWRAVITQAQSTAIPGFDHLFGQACTGADGPAEGSRGVQKGGEPGPNSSRGRLSTGCQTAADLVRQTYVNYATGQLVRDPSAPPIEGAPESTKSEQYVIDARANGSPSEK